jgi:hypothetical protein
MPWGYFHDEDATSPWNLPGVTPLVLPAGVEADPVPPCFFPISDASQVSVAQQPSFRTTVANNKLTYPTSGTGAGNASARDGNPFTAASLGVSDVITLTFNDAPAPFANGDTVASTLHVITQGDITFTDLLGSTTYGVASGASGTNHQFRFTQGAARDFNATVRCVGTGASGGNVVEVWWEHDLSTDEDATRTADVVLTGSGAVGEILEYAEMVLRLPSSAYSLAAGITFGSRDYGAGDDSREVEDPQVLSGTIPYPDAVMASLQGMLLGPADGSIQDVNVSVYNAARAFYVADDIRLSFVLNQKLNSWTELEKAVALQSRAHMYYGPSGHEIVFMQSTSGLDSADIVQEFRLPGVPGVNAAQGQGQLYERLPASQILNTVEAEFNLDYITRTYQNKIKAIDADSVAALGERRDPRASTSYKFWAHALYGAHPTFDATATLSGMLAFYADRAAFGATRFVFSTAWVAHGVERGSFVRVVYEVAPLEPLNFYRYRNVVCEVEQIAVSPAAGERFSLIVRALGPPTNGLPAFFWLDVFDDLTDTWEDEIVDGSLPWKSYWSI